GLAGARTAALRARISVVCRMSTAALPTSASMPTAIRTRAMRTSRSVNPARLVRMTDNVCVYRTAPSPFRCMAVLHHALDVRLHEARTPGDVSVAGGSRPNVRGSPPTASAALLLTRRLAFGGGGNRGVWRVERDTALLARELRVRGRRRPVARASDDRGGVDRDAGGRL